MRASRFTSSSSLTQISHQNLEYARHLKAIKETASAIDMKRPKTFKLRKSLNGPSHCKNENQKRIDMENYHLMCNIIEIKVSTVLSHFRFSQATSR